MATLSLSLKFGLLQQLTGLAVSDTWDNYQVGGMDVQSVTGGADKSDYEKVVVMLHGGGGSGSDWRYNYDAGWFGNTSGLKYVFPTSPIASHVWFNTFKNGCGLKDDCAYDIPSIQSSATAVASLIQHEKSLVGGDASKVYLAGFSEGAQMTGYMQLAKLDFALGGTIVMDGYPIPPLCDMPGHAQADARKNASYYGSDMRWMIWHGAADPIFPEGETMTAWHGIFDALGVRSTLQVEHIEPGMTHTLIQSEFEEMVAFVRGQPIPPSPPSPTPPSPSPSGNKDYVCYEDKCYEKPGYGTMDQATCEKTCSSPAPSPPAPPAPSPSGNKDYMCYENKCYEKPGYGTMDQPTCEKTCSSPAPSPPAPPAPSPSGNKDYLCYESKCYEKPGYGTMDEATCEKTCSSAVFV